MCDLYEPDGYGTSFADKAIKCSRAGEGARRPDWMTELHEFIDW